MYGESAETLDQYRQMICEGQSPGIASILATRRPPALETDTNHFLGLKHTRESIGNDYDEKIWKRARAAGINVSDSNVYNPTIADERGPGDPGAWLLAGDGRGKWKRTLEERGGRNEDLGVNALEKGREIVAAKDAKIDKIKRHKRSLRDEVRDKVAAGKQITRVG